MIVVAWIIVGIVAFTICGLFGTCYYDAPGEVLVIMGLVVAACLFFWSLHVLDEHYNPDTPEVPNAEVPCDVSSAD